MEDLARQYGATADILLVRLAQLRQELAGARGDEAFSLQKRIEVLRQELWDLRDTMWYLSGYYEG